MRAFESRLRKIETAQRRIRGTSLERMTDDQLWAELFSACAQLERIEGARWKEIVAATWFDRPGEGPSYLFHKETQEQVLADLYAGYEARRS
ncbi:hypothetical protein GCM10007036_31100 [Alsobacter metallidurans]|uniref:Uncharacterized protein n=1 Tax=Alsobacter metallidurans TaxID=340221 RepID=A0A917MII1_9HYPH|nr:hypothetical protein [Alsobacter metallidurans]GGH24588.1 hypothetical protein GCM10007036_31100 [Alsobacter metallidurans]